MKSVAAALAPLCVLLAAGCGELLVEPFRGSWISLALSWPLVEAMPPPGLPPQPQLLPPGEHLELWAQLPDRGFVRLLADDVTDPAAFPGFEVRPALDVNDACMIRGLDPDDACARDGLDDAVCGAHLLSLDAQHGDDAAARELMRQQVIQHARQVTSQATEFTTAPAVRGKAPLPLLVLVQADAKRGAEPAPGHRLILTEHNAGAGEEAGARLAHCRRFASDHGAYYLGNPLQLTKPLHGVLYGFFSFNTTAVPGLPPQSFGGITLTTRTPLLDISALLITRETAASPRAPSADPARHVIKGTRLPESMAGRGAIRMALAAEIPVGPGMTRTTLVGSASVLTHLSEGLD